MADFKKQGGTLGGREERYDGFEGEPRAVGGALGGASSGTTGSSGLTGSHGTSGPHSSSLGNKADPRVDSDRDGSRTAGSTGYGSGTTGSGYGSGTTGTGYGSSGSGPHSSSLGNKADPRVDSDGSRGYGAGSTGTGTTGSGYGSGTTGSGYGSSGAGPHSSGAGNKIDPRVDSDGSRGYGSGSTGTGTTGTTGTTGKKPGLMDKLNPMKDTDHDGKKGFME